MDNSRPIHSLDDIFNDPDVDNVLPEKKKKVV